MTRPTRPPTTVPLIRMNCRSRPTCSSIRSAASLPSQRFTVVEITVAEIRPLVRGHLADVFGLTYEPAPADVERAFAPGRAPVVA